MDRPIFPPEILNNIFSNLDTFELEKAMPEVFQAIAPFFFRSLTLGQLSFPNAEEDLKNELAWIYPTSGNYVHKLTIVIDMNIKDQIIDFLSAFPFYRNLKHIIFFHSFQPSSGYNLRKIGLSDFLRALAANSPELTRLTFDNILPSCSLIQSIQNRMTRLDIAYPFDTSETMQIPLPPLLEVLSFTPSAAHLFTSTRDFLEVLIVKTENLVNTIITDECIQFIQSCTTVTKLGIFDYGMLILSFNFLV